MAHRSDFQCDVKSVAYDFQTRTGTLRMAADHCCDMAGCIAFFVRVDPAVSRIDTFSGSNPDTIYARTNGHWMIDLRA
jgi:hypothetical protein